MVTIINTWLKLGNDGGRVKRNKHCLLSFLLWRQSQLLTEQNTFTFTTFLLRANCHKSKNCVESFTKVKLSVEICSKMWREECCLKAFIVKEPQEVFSLTADYYCEGGMNFIPAAGQRRPFLSSSQTFNSVKHLFLFIILSIFVIKSNVNKVSLLISIIWLFYLLYCCLFVCLSSSCCIIVLLCCSFVLTVWNNRKPAEIADK